MDAGLAQRITEKAYELDPDGLEQAVKRLGLTGWLDSTRGLQFEEIGTGGGCDMLSAVLPDPDGHQVIITDGEAGVPVSLSQFWLAIVDVEETEVFSVSTERLF